MRTVSFGMFWQCYGRQTISLPDDVPDDDDSVLEYIQSVWDDVPLPDSDYVTGSDELDMECDIRIHGNPDTAQVYTDGDLPYAVDRNVKVEWYDAGEGFFGDYNPENQYDVPLARFDVYVRRNDRWEAVEDASYCTLMPLTADRDILARAAGFLAKEYADILADDPDASVKKLGESLSWIGPDWFAQPDESQKSNNLHKENKK